jgi:hypothetical protein
MFLVNIILNVIFTILAIIGGLFFAYNKFVPLDIRNQIQEVIKTGGEALITILTPLFSKITKNIFDILGIDQDTISKLPDLLDKVNGIDLNLINNISTSAGDISGLYNDIANLNNQVSTLIYPNSPLTQLGSLSPSQVNRIIDISNTDNTNQNNFNNLNNFNNFSYTS